MQPAASMALNPFMVALALSITKAKPEHISMQEYLREINDACLRRRADHSRSHEQHDIQYKQLEDTITRLEAQLRARAEELSVLEHRQKELEELLHLSKDDTLLVYAQSLMPVTPEQLSISSESTPRLRNDVLTSLPKDQCQAILYNTLRVECLINQTTSTDPSMLTTHLLRILPAVLQIVRSLPLPSASPNSAQTIRSSLSACARAVSIVLKGQRYLDVRFPKFEYHRQVDYAVVDLFRQLTLLLGETSQHELNERKDEEQSRTRPSTRSSTKMHEQREHQRGRRDHATMLVALLLHMLRTLDANSAAHKRVFEGFLANLMSVVGHSLFQITFGHPRGSSIEEDIRATLSARSLDAHAPGSARITPSIVRLLEQALRIAPTFSPRDVNETDALNTSDGTHASMTPLLKARLQLQEMLLDAIFGTSQELGRDTLVIGGQLPDLEVPPLPPILSENANQWFQEEVWRVIGWEILAA